GFLLAERFVPRAQAQHSQKDEKREQYGREIKTLIKEDAYFQGVHHNPKPPVGDVFARGPPLRDQAVASQRGVNVRQRRIGVTRHQKAQQETPYRANHKSRCKPSPGKPFHSDDAFFLHPVPPMPPTVNGKGKIDKLQQHVRVKLFAPKNQRIQNAGDKNHRPGRKLAPRRQPNAEDTRKHGCNFKRRHHLFTSAETASLILAKLGCASAQLCKWPRSRFLGSLLNQRACPRKYPAYARSAFSCDFNTRRK